MTKRIYLYAYTALNLGDDLFLKILCDRYPEIKFYIMCSKKTAFALNKISNLTVIPIPLFERLLKRLHANLSINNIFEKFISSFCDAVINIGGSIFMEADNWEDTTNQYQKKLINNKPFYIIGSNFGPYKDNEYYEKYKHIFEHVTDICFRDKYSYDLFSDLPNVRQAADVVFSYTPPIVKYYKKQIVISVIDLSNRDGLEKYSKVYLSKIIELSRYFIEKGYVVYLMGFCEIEGDKKSILQILSYLNNEEKKYAIPYYYSGDLDEALNLIQGSQFILASRFHAMILGWVFHKSVYPIVYSDKSINVIEDVGFTGLYARIQNSDKINAEEVFNYLTENEPLNIEEQIYSANQQFKILDAFLMQ